MTFSPRKNESAIGIGGVVTTFFETICNRFEQYIFHSNPHEGYQFIRKTAIEIVTSGLGEIDSPDDAILDVIPSSPRNADLIPQMNKIYRLFESNEQDAAIDAAQLLADTAEKTGDVKTRIDCMHLLGRFRHSQRILEEVLQLSIEDRYEEGFVRAIHELARICLHTNVPLRAEAGFRFTLDYYSFKFFQAQNDETPFHEVRLLESNVNASLNCIGNLREILVLYLSGPSEAGEFIRTIDIPDVREKFDAGFEFIDVRAMALAGICMADGPSRIMKLRNKAALMRSKYPRIASLAENEASYLEGMYGG